MKSFMFQLSALLLCMLVTAQLRGQSNPGDKLSVPLSDPGRPANLKVGLISGSITVKGYSGKEVIVEALQREDHDEQEAQPEEAHGLHRIPNTSTGLTVEEDDNEVTVGTGALGGPRTTDLVIQVPTNTSMKLSTINDGQISVSNVRGDIEASNTNGIITLTKIAGSAVADALNGNITVTFSEVDPKKSMSFSSLNGDIDVTLPPKTGAMVRMKTEQGDIYTDFDIKLEKSGTKIENNSDGQRGKYRVSMEKVMTGTLNGGGPEITFKNFNGSIYIRKGTAE